MKKMTLVVVLALVLTFAFTASAFATTGKFFAGGVDYYKWLTPTTSPSPGTAWVKNGVATVGVNSTNTGAHSNYLANTAKCGMCHSVHRAAGAGVKLLPTSDATCAGCHTGSTTITSKIITWGTLNMAWRAGDPASAAFATGGAGPHNDALNTLYGDGEWDGVSVPPSPSYAVDPFARYGCFTRRCHATNPHGANSSKYKIFAKKLLFNNTPAQDDATYPDLVAENGNGTYGGLDAAYNTLGATDASVQRFVDNNSGVMSVDALGNIAIHGVAPDANEEHALVAGLTCGRPCNPATGEDECHAEASYAIVDKAIKENRNHGTGISGNDGTGPAPLIEDTDPESATFGQMIQNKNAYRTDNTGAEYNSAGVWYSGGNGNRDSKTGHVAGTFAAVPGAGSYVAIAGCTSCHDQTDENNTVASHFTFPHGQTPTGVTNAQTAAGGSGTMQRSRIWSGWAGFAGAQRTISGSPEKAFDGQCLKCHRNTLNSAGIGIDK